MSSSPGSAATSSRAKRPIEPPDATAPLVQQLLAERRELMVANERLRLEAGDLRRMAGRNDPRLRTLEAENARLREQLEAARAERDSVLAGIARVLEALRRA